ncbi:MaoC family dehydratase [Brevundimonas sp. DC300-4]|uniref:MaoC family dehydratase n=1 Tax=unclassified Brevundimonas TaxID=2622653 RepID=UPI003CF7212B
MTSQTHGQMPAADALKPMSPLQARQTREFIDGLASEARPYWDMVEIGDELSRDLHLSAELVILYCDGVEDFNPWYEGWRMNSWHIEGQSPFGGAIVPPLLVSHFVLSVQFDATRPFSIGSIHTYHDSEIVAPIPVGANVRITTRAIDKFEKRGRRYVRHGVEVTDVESGLLYFRETRDILSL